MVSLPNIATVSFRYDVVTYRKILTNIENETLLLNCLYPPLESGLGHTEVG